MDDKEILEGNRIIAEFMGAIPNKNAPHIGCRLIIKNNKTPSQCWWHLLKYNSSWDWLMPVVDKIEVGLSDCFGYISINAIKVESYSSGCLKKKLPFFHYKEDGTRFNGKDKLEATYRAIIEFIKWYNKNNS